MADGIECGDLATATIGELTLAIGTPAGATAVTFTSCIVTFSGSLPLSTRVRPAPKGTVASSVAGGCITSRLAVNVALLEEREGTINAAGVNETGRAAAAGGERPRDLAGTSDTAFEVVIKRGVSDTARVGVVADPRGVRLTLGRLRARSPERRAFAASLFDLERD